jgi:hypothetical protein
LFSDRRSQFNKIINVFLLKWLKLKSKTKGKKNLFSFYFLFFFSSLFIFHVCVANLQVATRHSYSLFFSLLLAAITPLRLDTALCRLPPCSTVLSFVNPINAIKPNSTFKLPETT